MISLLAPSLPSVWCPHTRGGRADLSDKNSQSRIKTYMDGVENVSVKDLLAKATCGLAFAIQTFVIPAGASINDRAAIESFGPEGGAELEFQSFLSGLAPSDIWFIKPAHPFIGSAKGIILTAGANMRRAIGGLGDRDTVSYVVQPSIRPVTFRAAKWDCRHYAVLVYNEAGDIAVYPYGRAFARVATAEWQGDEDPASQITNIALNELSPTYDPDQHMIEVLPAVTETYLREIVTASIGRIEQHLKPEPGTAGYVVLGVDTMFSPTADHVDVSPESPDLKRLLDERKISPKLIEINAQPAMNASANIEGVISQGIWSGLLSLLLPWTVGDAAPPPPPPGFTAPHRVDNAAPPSAPSKWAVPARPKWVKDYASARKEIIDATGTHAPKHAVQSSAGAAFVFSPIKSMNPQTALRVVTQYASPADPDNRVSPPLPFSEGGVVGGTYSAFTVAYDGSETYKPRLPIIHTAYTSKSMLTIDEVYTLPAGDLASLTGGNPDPETDIWRMRLAAIAALGVRGQLEGGAEAQWLADNPTFVPAATAVKASVNAVDLRQRLASLMFNANLAGESESVKGSVQELDMVNRMHNGDLSINLHESTCSWCSVGTTPGLAVTRFLGVAGRAVTETVVTLPAWMADGGAQRWMCFRHYHAAALPAADAPYFGAHACDGVGGALCGGWKVFELARNGAPRQLRVRSIHTISTHESEPASEAHGGRTTILIATEESAPVRLVFNTPKAGDFSQWGAELNAPEDESRSPLWIDRPHNTSEARERTAGVVGSVLKAAPKPRQPITHMSQVFSESHPKLLSRIVGISARKMEASELQNMFTTPTQTADAQDDARASPQGYARAETRFSEMIAKRLDSEDMIASKEADEPADVRLAKARAAEAQAAEAQSDEARNEARIKAWNDADERAAVKFAEGRAAKAQAAETQNAEAAVAKAQAALAQGTDTQAAEDNVARAKAALARLGETHAARALAADEAAGAQAAAHRLAARQRAADARAAEARASGVRFSGARASEVQAAKARVADARVAVFKQCARNPYDTSEVALAGRNAAAMAAVVAGATTAEDVRAATAAAAATEPDQLSVASRVSDALLRLAQIAATRPASSRRVAELKKAAAAMPLYRGSLDDGVFPEGSQSQSLASVLVRGIVKDVVAGREISALVAVSRASASATPADQAAMLRNLFPLLRAETVDSLAASGYNSGAAVKSLAGSKGGPFDELERAQVLYADSLLLPHSPEEITALRQMVSSAFGATPDAGGVSSAATRSEPYAVAVHSVVSDPAINGQRATQAGELMRTHVVISPCGDNTMISPDAVLKKIELAVCAPCFHGEAMPALDRASYAVRYVVMTPNINYAPKFVTILIIKDTDSSDFGVASLLSHMRTDSGAAAIGEAAAARRISLDTSEQLRLVADASGERLPATWSMAEAAAAIGLDLGTAAAKVASDAPQNAESVAAEARTHAATGGGFGAVLQPGRATEARALYMPTAIELVNPSATADIANAPLGAVFRRFQHHVTQPQYEIEMRFQHVTPKQFFRLLNQWRKSTCAVVHTTDTVHSVADRRDKRISYRATHSGNSSAIGVKAQISREVRPWMYGVAQSVAAEAVFTQEPRLKNVPAAERVTFPSVSDMETRRERERWTVYDGPVSIDATIASTYALRGKEAKLLFTSHEVEVEILDPSHIAALNETTVRVARHLFDTAELATSGDLDFVVNEFNSIIDGAFGARAARASARPGGPPAARTDFVAHARNLKRRDFAAGGPGPMGVATKADGETAFMLVSSDASVWVIAGADVSMVGRADSSVDRRGLEGIILVGESVPPENRLNSADRQYSKFFVPFDIVLPNRPQSRDYRERVGAIERVVDMLVNSAGYGFNGGTGLLKLVTKRIVFPPETPEGFADGLERARTDDFRTDGFILTPQNALINLGGVAPPPFGKQRRLADFPEPAKFKPWSDLTIDFRIVRGSGGSELHVGTPKGDAPFAPFGVKFDFARDVKWNTPVLSRALPGGAPAPDGSIVEFAPHLVDPNGVEVYAEGFDAPAQLGTDGWRVVFAPRRMRLDKASPNFVAVANDVWSDIVTPVAFSTVSGSTDFQILFQHNNALKRAAIDKVVGNAKSSVVVDIGSGYGGDVPKFAEWIRRGAVKHLILVEPSLENFDKMTARVAQIFPSGSERAARLSLLNSEGQDRAVIAETTAAAISAATARGEAVDTVIISMMLSLSFFWKDRAELKCLQRTFAAVADAAGGRKVEFVFFTIDGNAMERNIFTGTETREARFGPVVMRKVGNEGEIFIDIADTIVKSQTEYSVDLLDLADKSSAAHIDIKELKPSVDENDGVYMSADERRFASAFVVGYGDVVRAEESPSDSDVSDASSVNTSDLPSDGSTSGSDVSSVNTSDLSSDGSTSGSDVSSVNTSDLSLEGSDPSLEGSDPSLEGHVVAARKRLRDIISIPHGAKRMTMVIDGVLRRNTATRMHVVSRTSDRGQHILYGEGSVAPPVLFAAHLMLKKRADKMYNVQWSEGSTACEEAVRACVDVYPGMFSRGGSARADIFYLDMTAEDGTAGDDIVKMLYRAATRVERNGESFVMMAVRSPSALERKLEEIAEIGGLTDAHITFTGRIDLFEQNGSSEQQIGSAFEFVAFPPAAFPPALKIARRPAKARVTRIKVR
jgi:hypothetical protein